MPNLLIVDDEPNVLYSFERALARSDLEIASAETGRDALATVERDAPDAVVLDVRLPDMSGLEVFDRIRELDPRLPVIFVTAHSTTETAIDAMKRGAFEYLLKPVDIHELQDMVEKALELSRLRHVPAVFDESEEQPDSADLIVGRSKAMQEVYKTIGRVAEEDVTVLILGESGTGKELVARAIFHHSHRSDKPFLTINCAALPETLLESELFGHERGAFTGADRRRIGKFEQADGGTLFLDELGDMTPATQAKVLRVLQDGRFERVGGSETIETDVRVIAATNQDLDAKIDAGEFRSDLLYRLNGFTIRLPALRDRLDDLPLLVEHLLKRERQVVGKPALAMSETAGRLLETYNWPGNVRELQSVIKYAVLHAVGDVITPDCLPESCRGPASPDEESATIENELAGVARFVRRLLHAGEPELYRRLIAEVDRIAVREVMQHVDGNQVHASSSLGMSRTTLRAKLQSIGRTGTGELDHPPPAGDPST
jgi:nitrogen regulation protein NR(I)